MYDFKKASYTSTRGIGGNFLELSALIGVLPQDYLVHIKSGNEIIWNGIAWVFVYDDMGRRFKNYAVLDFAINYNNTDVEITVAWKP